jgi:spermidine synthase
MCEIDEDVCKVAKKYLPKLASTLIAKDEGREPRFELLFMDAAEYMKGHSNEFDVIIVDSSDPVGPAETLYSSEFYANMHAALRPGGIVCTQGECQWLHLDLIKKVIGDAKQLYPTVEYAFASVPTYPSGQIGFIIARKAGGGAGALAAGRAVPAAMRKELRYYSEAVHRACFALPRFAEQALPAAAAPAAAAGGASPARLALVAAAAALGGAAIAALLLRRK